MSENIRTLETLLKISTNHVEQKQKEIALVNAKLDGIEQRMTELNKAIEDESKNVADENDPALYRAAGNFHERAVAEIDLLKQALALTEKEWDEKQAELRDLFSEQKRHEILLQRRLMEEKKVTDKKSQRNLDELAGTRHQRSQD